MSTQAEMRTAVADADEQYGRRPEGVAPILVVLYLRLSDFRNEDDDTFEQREKKLREYAARLGWVVLEVIIENDVTPGKRRGASAFKRRRVQQPDGTYKMRVWRPGFQRVLELLRTRRAQALLAEDLDRAMRDSRDLEDLIDVVAAHGCYADSPSGSLRFTAGGNGAERAMARVMVSMAAKSSEDTVRRVADSRERSARAGKWAGGKRPFGFEADGVTFRPAEVEEIVKACEGVLTKVPLRQIVADLRKRGVPTSSGAAWSPSTVKDILLRPRNAGLMVYRPQSEHENGNRVGRHYRPDEVVARAPWEPIVPEDTWRAVVAALTDPNRTTTPGRANRWLGSGMYLCICGAPMHVLKNKKASPAYRCRDTGSGNGLQHTVRNVAAVDKVVVGAIVEMMSRPDAAELSDVRPDGQVDLGALRAEVATLRARKKAFADDRAAGLIDREDMLTGTARIRHEIEKREAVLAAHTSRSPLSPLIGADDVQAVWDGLSLGVQREIVRKLLTVTILPSAARGRAPFDPTTVRIERAARSEQRSE